MLLQNLTGERKELKFEKKLWGNFVIKNPESVRQKPAFSL